MADGVEIKVDTTRAVAKMNRVPVAVRDRLRSVIPDLTKALGRAVDAKLDTELKSRTRLKVGQYMVEGPREIYGSVKLEWTGAAEQAMVPNIIESGARAHEIVAVNARALSFFWERVGQQVMFKRVMHPGFPGIHIMERTFGEQRDKIVADIQAAAKEGAKEAG